MLSWMSGIINPNPWRLCVHVRCIVVRKREQARASARACVCGGAIPRSLCVFLFLPSRHSFSCAEHGIAMGKGPVFYSEIGKKARGLWCFPLSPDIFVVFSSVVVRFTVCSSRLDPIFFPSACVQFLFICVCLCVCDSFLPPHCIPADTVPFPKVWTE